MSDLRTTAIADVIRRRLEGQPQDGDWAMQIALVAVPATEAVIAADWYGALAHAEWIALGRPEDHEW